MDWYRVQADGGLTPARAPADARPLHWVEADAEHLLAVNPGLLGLTGQLPVRLDGSSTTMSPDQAYVDELGRLTVVELKRVPAKLPVLAQAIAYADHWRTLPPGETGGVRGVGTAADLRGRLGRSAARVRSWAGATGGRAGSARADGGDGRAVVDRARAGWRAAVTRGVERLARLHAGEHPYPMLGASARVVVVAPGFDDAAEGFAEHLTGRLAAVELVRLDVRRSSAGTFVGREWVHRHPYAEPTWGCLRRLWRAPAVRDHFVPNGWADGLNREAFSLSLRGVPDARFWIEATADEGTVFTVVPDGWHRGDAAGRRDLRARFLEGLPEPDGGGRWYEWEFELPARVDAMDRCAAAVAVAVRRVLGEGPARR